MITVKINVRDQNYPKARYVFGLLAQAWGIPVRILRSDDPASPDVVYTAKDSYPKGQEHPLIIRSQSELYEPNTSCQLREVEGNLLWTRSPFESGPADLVAGIYRLVTFLDEHQVGKFQRDTFGSFRVSALPSTRKEAAQIPLTEHHAEYLLNQILKRKPNLAAAMVPRWPDNKKYAVAITHDTDAIGLGVARELLTNFLKAVLRRDKTYFEMFKAGLCCFRRPQEDPFFGFPAWREYESAQQIRSCFYLYAKSKGTRFSIHDCKSSVADRRTDWDMLRTMAGDGWEFGLHAATHAREGVETFTAPKKFLEERLQQPVPGLRHHYYALDWFRPWVTFRKHEQAGFRYDTSIAWRETAGFRAATCLPFRPFDPETNQPLSLYELPTCLMDGHVMGREVAEATQRGIDILEMVKNVGGVAVVDWHTESGCNRFKYKDHLTALQQILRPFLKDSDAWFATPWEVVQHWEKRASKPILENPHSA